MPCHSNPVLSTTIRPPVQGGPQKAKLVSTLRPCFQLNRQGMAKKYSFETDAATHVTVGQEARSTVVYHILVQY